MFTNIEVARNQKKAKYICLIIANLKKDNKIMLNLKNQNYETTTPTLKPFHFSRITRQRRIHVKRLKIRNHENNNFKNQFNISAL